MTEHLWLVYAVLSAVMAALVSIFGKIGLQGLDADTATVIRAVIMALFLIAVMAVQRNFGHVGEILADRRALTFIILSGTAGAMSWLFYFAALKYGRVSPVDKLSVVIASVAAVVFLGESLSMLSASGIALITVGIIMVALG